MVLMEQISKAMAALGRNVMSLSRGYLGGSDSELWVSIFKRQIGTQLELCIEFLKQVIDDLVSK